MTQQLTNQTYLAFNPAYNSKIESLIYELDPCGEKSLKVIVMGRNLSFLGNKIKKKILHLWKEVTLSQDCYFMMKYHSKPWKIFDPTIKLSLNFDLYNLYEQISEIFSGDIIRRIIAREEDEHPQHES